MDLSAFASQHPEMCDRGKLLALGVSDAPPAARPLPLTPESLESFTVSAPKDPDALGAMLKQGPEAIATYVSFRVDPRRFGTYLREGGLRSLKEEYHRIIWRDLGKYADKDITEVAERIEYSLVLDYLLTHARLHHLVDLVAAQRELADGRARYIPYIQWREATAKRPPSTPQQFVNLEETIANFEAFKNFINPGYCESIARLVQGRLDERNVQEWQAFFIGGRWGTELAASLSRQPPGFRDFTKLLNRTTSVGATSYVRVKYSYNKDAYDSALKLLSLRIEGAEPAGDLSETPNYFAVEPPEVPVFLTR
ncbi:MAG TPA: hypothetical protein VIL58_01840 [Thermoplasmata archaeon]